jgi:hypothetical protein
MSHDDTERNTAVTEALEESADAQRHAAETIDKATARLERLAEIMRRHGPFPLVSQISRGRGDDGLRVVRQDQ